MNPLGFDGEAGHRHLFLAGGLDARPAAGGEADAGEDLLGLDSVREMPANNLTLVFRNGRQPR